MKRLIPVAVLVCALALVTGAMAASPLTGQYQAHVSRAGSLNGTWILTFSANGFYTVAKKPKTSTVLSGGGSTVSGKTITLFDHSGPMACKTPAQYTFAVSGKSLRFTKVTDTCSGRLALLGSGWTKVG